MIYTELYLYVRLYMRIYDCIDLSIIGRDLYLFLMESDRT